MLKGKPLAVVQLQYVGERDVVGLSTGTGTLVAEGIASHNSDRAFDPSYSGSGGQRHHGVIGYICPSETVAARWRNAPAAAVGCPKLDLMAGLRAATDRSDDPPLVVFAWHWDCLLVPETRSALDHYVADLPALKERIEQQGWDVQHHFHPKWRGAPIDASNVLADEVSVFRWASLLVVDNSSLAYEAAALDIPVVLLNAPWYRRDVEHGLRFWEYPPGIQVDDPEHLMSLNLWDFVTPGTVHHRASEVLGKRAAEHAYTAVDGKASERAAAFITSLLDEM